MDSKVGGAVCQGMKDYSVFNFKTLSSVGVTKKKNQVSFTIKAGASFIDHRICSTSFLPDSKKLNDGGKPPIDAKSCKKMYAEAPGNMYLMTEKSGKSICSNSFKYGKFDADIEHDKKTGKVTKQSWELKYKSLQKCSADSSKHFEIKIKGTCAPKVKAGKMKLAKSEKCKVSINYASKDACIAATFPLQKYMAKIAPFTGIVLIIGGLACTFAGSKFVPIAISFLMFLAGSGGIFMVGYNFLPPTTVKMWSLIVLLVVAILIGILIAWIAYKFL